jgi:hypothetical protein
MPSPMLRTFETSRPSGIRNGGKDAERVKIVK